MVAPARRVLARARRVDLAGARPRRARGSGDLRRGSVVSSTPGAVVIGGDYQGLGIVRSLGRRGVDVVVIDDEHSISRHSRYASGSYRFSDLRTDEETVGALLSVAERRDVEGWVVFPTREETVAALSRHRPQLLKHFRIPTPDWSVTQWAWDKRNTYAHAAE